MIPVLVLEGELLALVEVMKVNFMAIHPSEESVLHLHIPLRDFVLNLAQVHTLLQVL